MQDAVHTTLLWLIWIGLAYLGGLSAVTIVGALRLGGRRDEVADSQGVAAGSRFTIPVSVVMPVSENNPELTTSIEMALALEYSEFELILIVDTGLPQVLANLEREWALAPTEVFYRRTAVTAPVRRIFRSGADARLTVVEKEPAGRADALNCGVDLARFRYVCSVGANLRLASDALLRVMAPALLDPAHVLAVSSHVEAMHLSSGNGETNLLSRARSMWATFHARLQRLASIRGAVQSRVGPGCDPMAGTPVVVWRRDALLTAAGFNPMSPDPELDLLLRLPASAERGGVVVRGGEILAQATALPPGEWCVAFARRQRTLFRAVTAALSSLEPRRIAAIAPYLVSWLITPAVKTAVLILLTLGSIAGWLDAWAACAVLGIVAFSTACTTTASLLVRGASEGTPDERELWRLLVASPLEWLVYGPLAGAARAAALLRH